MSNPLDYTIAWICAIHVENVAAEEFLDVEHPPPMLGSIDPQDPNVYKLGRMGVHNIVIASLPIGLYANYNSATVASNLTRSFRNVRFALLVGVGGGAPTSTNDIRLGDVVVSVPTTDGSSGVFQYDFGKEVQGKAFKSTGHLNRPPTILLSAVAQLRTQYRRKGHDIKGHVAEVLRNNPRLRREYQRPESDILYNRELVHPVDAPAGDCKVVCGDSKENVIMRIERAEHEDDPVIHYGIIASGNRLMKNAQIRHQLAEEQNIMCFEMEAAGLLSAFPCLVIRGICDYADSHKNDVWQGHAALTAAAYAKDLLKHIQPTSIEVERTVLDVISGIGGDIRKLIHLHDNQALDEFLEWLTPIRYAIHHRANLAKRHRGTGLWFLSSPAYQTWCTGDTQTLFCYGIPGSGKTIITATVVEHLTTDFQDTGSVAIVHLYLSYQSATEQTLGNLLGSLVKQLLRQMQELPDQQVRNMYADKLKENLPQVDEHMAALRYLVTMYSKVYIVVDALDECSDDPAGVQGRHRSKLLAAIRELQLRGCVNLLATARLIPDIEKMFTDCPSFEIRATDEDLDVYLNDCVAGITSVTISPELKTDIVRRIKQAVDGMFLMARLYVSSLQEAVHMKEVSDILEDMERKLAKASTDKTGVDQLDQVYDTIMTRVNRQTESHRRLALKILPWVTYARRMLTTFELEHAVSIEVGDTQVDRTKFPRPDLIVSVCCGLITVDDQNQQVSLVHYTAQKFLKRRENILFPHSNKALANTCLTYLQMNIFEKVSHGRYDRPPPMDGIELYDYAARNWGHHARDGDLGADPALMSFLRDKTKFRLSARLLLELEQRGGIELLRMRAMHLAAYFGLSHVIRQLQQEKHALDPGDFEGRTPLWMAINMGHTDTVQELCCLGAHVNISFSISASLSQTPLARAALSGNLQIVKILLRFGARIGTPRDPSPLLWVVQHATDDILLLLLENHVKADNKAFRDPMMEVWAIKNRRSLLVIQKIQMLRRTSKNNTRWLHRIHIKGLPLLGSHNPHLGTEGKFKPNRLNNPSPLVLAAEVGHLQAVEAFLEDMSGPSAKRNRDSDINARNYIGQTALMLAAMRGHERVTEILLIHGADFKLTDQSYRTALSLALDNGHTSTAKCLLDHGASPNQRIENGKTVLGKAVEARARPIIKFLLAEGVSPEYSYSISAQSSKLRFLTPLDEASSNGDLETVQVLLENGARVHLSDEGQGGPVWHAAACGNAVLMELLLRNNVDRDWLSLNGEACLAKAVREGHMDTAAVLVKFCSSGLSITSEDIRKLLAWAVVENHSAIWHHLLDLGVDVNSPTNSDGQTSLSLAAMKGNITAVSALLSRRDIVVNAWDVHHRTPLSYAAANGHVNVIDFFMQAHAELDLKDISGCTPLWHAVSHGHYAVVKMLVTTGWVDMETMSDSGEALLWRAAHNGDEKLVDFLLDHQPSTASAASHYNRSPLSISAVKGHYTIIKKLLAYGLDPDEKDTLGRSPLSLAAAAGHSGVVRELLTKGVDITSTDECGRGPLLWAAHSGQAATLGILLRHCKTHEVPVDLDRLAYWCCANNKPRILDLLLNYGANPNYLDQSGQRLLTLVVSRGHLELAAALLERGADPNLINHVDCRSALWSAADSGHLELVKLLIKHGASLEIRDILGRSPLVMAKKREWNLIVEYLEQVPEIRGINA
ncbi:ankyrin repeat-containing domain protein [Aspergillus insuetus]